MYSKKLPLNCLQLFVLCILFISCGQLDNQPLSFTKFIYASPQKCSELEISTPVVQFITGRVTFNTIILSASGSTGVYEGSFIEEYIMNTGEATWRQFSLSCKENPLVYAQTKIMIPNRTDRIAGNYNGHVVTIKDDASQPGSLGISIVGYQ